MSNVKEVSIKGFAPFNLHEDEDACKILGQLNAPIFGLRLVWEGTSQDGKFAFKIYGKEAVSYKYLLKMLQTLETADVVIDSAMVRDIENLSAWHQIRECFVS